VKNNSDENQALVARTRKGRRGSPSKRVSLEREASPEPRWKKDLTKIRCFECHDYGHYASQCPHQKGRGRRQQASATKVDEVANMFQREILMVSAFSGIVSSRGILLVDNKTS
jgi:hypothetical protein